MIVSWSSANNAMIFVPLLILSIIINVVIFFRILKLVNEVIQHERSWHRTKTRFGTLVGLFHILRDSANHSKPGLPIEVRRKIYAAADEIIEEENTEWESKTGL